jgi:hypothetical protein
MSNRWSRLLSISFTASLGLAAFGCGDDDGGGERPDAREQADAAAEPDAGGEDGLLRSGTIAVTEAAITNDLPGGPWSGGLVSVGFSDATTGNVPPPVAGYETNINGCLIRVWDVDTHEGSDSVDEGAVLVTGSENGDFACGFNAGQGEYLCQSTNPAIAMGSLDGVTIVDNVMTFVAEGTQTAPEMVGMYMVVQGHPNIPDGSKIPIIDQDTGADTLTIAGVGTVLPGDADSGFATFVGAGPVPAGGAQFLLGAAADLNISKAAGDVVGVIDEDFTAHGQNFELVDDAAMDKYLPHTVPFDGSVVNFECDGAGCGAAGTGGVIEALVINGETTDAPDLDPVTSPATAMPAPVTQYATFQCSFVGSDTATLDAGAMAAILGTSPTRIQVSVGRYRGAILASDDGTSSTIVLQGHQLLGWSDAPPK